jgi:hypothetical protein
MLLAIFLIKKKYKLIYDYILLDMYIPNVLSHL